MTTYQLRPVSDDQRIRRYCVVAIEKDGSERLLMIFDSEQEAKACITRLPSELRTTGQSS
jgi:hypothetical protein